LWDKQYYKQLGSWKLTKTVSTRSKVILLHEGVVVEKEDL